MMNPGPSASNEKFVEVCEQIALQIDIAQQSLEVWDWVGENAVLLNEANVGVFFGVAQRTTLHEIVLAICRIFDDTEHGETASIKLAVQLLPERPLQSRDEFVKYLKGSGRLPKAATKATDEELIDLGIRLIHRRRPTEKNCKPLRNLKKIRHEWIAHNAVTKTQKEFHEGDIPFCLNWAEQFIRMAYLCFGSHPMPSRVWSPKTSLIKLCHKARIIQSPLFPSIE